MWFSDCRYDDCPRELWWLDAICILYGCVALPATFGCIWRLQKRDDWGVVKLDCGFACLYVVVAVLLGLLWPLTLIVWGVAVFIKKYLCSKGHSFCGFSCLPRPEGKAGGDEENLGEQGGDGDHVELRARRVEVVDEPPPVYQETMGQRSVFR